MSEPVLKVAVVIKARSWEDAAFQLAEMAEDGDAMNISRGECQKWSTMRGERPYGQHGHVYWLTPPERRSE